MLSSLAIIASLLSAGSAHQNFHQFWVNDVSPGYQVSIRMPPSNSPVTDLTSNDLACNANGNVVLSSVITTPANEGDSIKVKWDSSTHPGPISHFLFGPVQDASQATGVGSWFKIDEFDSENGTWANVIMAAQDMTYTFKLPIGLQSGEYLLRSEMLALHGAGQVGGAQFYIGCAQLKITGTGSAAFSPQIELPGAYKADDANIHIPNFYHGFDISTYTAPGGPVAIPGGSPRPVSSSRPVPVPTANPTPAPAIIPSSTFSAVPLSSALAANPTLAAGKAAASSTGPKTTSTVPTKKAACKAKTTTPTTLSTATRSASPSVV
ncbi:putative endoglucanase II [Diplocarpon rosae]|nr:putative endoglucanase II [Diplocarpon rosae]